MSEGSQGQSRRAARVRVLLVLGILAASVMLLQEPGDGQTFYRWTDENGVVHIADAPPLGRSFETEELVPPVSAPAEKHAGDGTTADSAKAGEPAGDKTPAPARVVIEKQSGKSLSGGVKSFVGEVKNSGDSEARNVVIEITVTDSVQGADCLNETITVEPSTLASGEKGSFSTELENPCFLGPTDVQLTPRWD